MYRLCWNSYIVCKVRKLESNLVDILQCSLTICTFAMALSCQIAGLNFGLTKLPTSLVPNLGIETIRSGEIF